MATHAEQVVRRAAPGVASVTYGSIVLAVLALGPSVASLARIWHESSDYQHGYLVAAISIAWLVRMRRDLDRLRVRPLHLATIPLAVGLFAWAIAFRANSELMQQLLVPVLVWLVVLATLGWPLARRVFLPLAYLYFAIPLWEQLLPLLQSATVVVSEHMLGMLRVPTEVDGNLVTIPEGRFAIIEGCSGKRYLVIGLAFAMLVGVLQGVPSRRLPVLLGIATALALLTNWIRVVIIIYAGHVSNMQNYLVAREHLTFGWLIFIPLLLGIAWTARRLSGPGLGDTRVAEPAWQGVRPAWWTLVLLVVPLAIVLSSRADSPVPKLGQLPLLTGAWQGPLPRSGEWHPVFVGAAAERHVTYSSPQQTLQVYLNVYGAQSQGHELVFFENRATPAMQWSVIERITDATDPLALSIVADASEKRWVIGEVYSVGGMLTSRPGLAQFYYGLHALWRPEPSGAIVIAADCAARCDAAATAVRAFWRTHGAVLANVIPARMSQ